jgi:hypothetical protein
MPLQGTSNIYGSQNGGPQLMYAKETVFITMEAANFTGLKHNAIKLGLPA